MCWCMSSDKWISRYVNLLLNIMMRMMIGWWWGIDFITIIGRRIILASRLMFELILLLLMQLLVIMMIAIGSACINLFRGCLRFGNTRLMLRLMFVVNRFVLILMVLIVVWTGVVLMVVLLLLLLLLLVEMMLGTLSIDFIWGFSGQMIWWMVLGFLILRLLGRLLR